MFITKLLLVIAVLGLLFTQPAYSEIYKCKTEFGKTIYSSKKCAQTADIFIPRKENIYRPQSVTNKSDSIENKPSNPEVDIYITSWCPSCKKAMAYLHSQDVYFNVYDIEKDPQARVIKENLDPGYTGIPLTVINGKLLKGFSESRFKRALFN